MHLDCCVQPSQQSDTEQKDSHGCQRGPGCHTLCNGAKGSPNMSRAGGRVVQTQRCKGKTWASVSRPVGWAESPFKMSFQRQNNEISYWGFTSHKSECPLDSLGAGSECITMDASEGLNLTFNLLLSLPLLLLLLSKGWLVLFALTCLKWRLVWKLTLFIFHLQLTYNISFKCTPQWLNIV